MVAANTTEMAEQPQTRARLGERSRTRLRLLLPDPPSVSPAAGSKTGLLQRTWTSSDDGETVNQTEVLPPCARVTFGSADRLGAVTEGPDSVTMASAPTVTPMEFEATAR